MENLNTFANENNQVNEKKPPPRVCPRCNSDNTKFCYYNNYSVSQPRYFCKNCRRFWTHGGTLRNIPIGGSGHKSKRTNANQPSVPQVVSIDIHQPFINVRDSNEFFGSAYGSSSSSTVAMNNFGSLQGIYDGMTTNVTPVQSVPQMDRFDGFSGGSFQQNYFNVGYNDLASHPFINQPTAENIDNDNNFRMNEEDHNKWNQIFNNNMNMNHNATTSKSGGYSTFGMNNNNMLE